MIPCIPPPPLAPGARPALAPPVPERWVEYDDEAEAPPTERNPDTLRCPAPPVSIPCESCGRPLSPRG